MADETLLRGLVTISSISATEIETIPIRSTSVADDLQDEVALVGVVWVVVAKLCNDQHGGRQVGRFLRKFS